MPAIQSACVALFGDAHLDETYLHVLAEDRCETGEWHDTALGVDRALARLGERFKWQALRSPVRQLFQTRQAEEKWYDGAAEIVALGYLQECRVLESVGWPSGCCGDDSPFDAAASVDGTEATRLAVDVKSAFRAGWKVLSRRLTGVARGWAEANGVGGVQVGLPRGAPLLQYVGDDLPGIVCDFARQLSGHHGMPEGGLEFRLGWAGSPSGILVTVTAAGVDTFALVDQLPFDDRGWGRTLLTHAQHKCEQAAQCRPRVPFLLLYVKPPGRGGVEMNDYVLSYARTTAAQSPEWSSTPDSHLWLGAGLLCWLEGQPHCALALSKPGGSWPPGLGPDQLIERLKAEDVTDYQ